MSVDSEQTLEDVSQIAYKLSHSPSIVRNGNTLGRFRVGPIGDEDDGDQEGGTVFFAFDVPIGVAAATDYQGGDRRRGDSNIAAGARIPG